MRKKGKRGEKEEMRRERKTRLPFRTKCVDLPMCPYETFKPAAPANKGHSEHWPNYARRTIPKINANGPSEHKRYKIKKLH